MPLVPANKTTTQLSLNLLKEGRFVLFNPAMYTALPGWIDLGEFPVDQKVSPSNTVNRTEVTASNREGGPDVILARNVTSVAIGYDISSLTPDDSVRQLHAGSASIPLTDPSLTGTNAFVINPASTLTGRMIIVRKRPVVIGRARIHRVVFHPSVDFSPNGNGDSNGQETLIFRAEVKPLKWTLSTALTPIATTLGLYGVQFDVDDSKLEALLTILDVEAKPVGDDV